MHRAVERIVCLEGISLYIPGTCLGRRGAGGGGGRLGGGVKALKFYGENSHDDYDCAHRQGPKLITPCDREIFRVPVFHAH